MGKRAESCFALGKSENTNVETANVLKTHSFILVEAIIIK
jgi:hypothetical protein